MDSKKTIFGSIPVYTLTSHAAIVYSQQALLDVAHETCKNIDVLNTNSRFCPNSNVALQEAQLSQR